MSSLIGLTHQHLHLGLLYNVVQSRGLVAVCKTLGVIKMNFELTRKGGDIRLLKTQLICWLKKIWYRITVKVPLEFSFVVLCVKAHRMSR